MGAVFVYKCFDVNRNILYIGCTADVNRRLKAHKYLSAWHSAMTYFEVTEFASKYDGLEFERMSIKTERPPHNKTSLVPKSPPKSGYEGVSYLKLTKTWEAQFFKNGVKYLVGSEFLTAERANYALQKMKIKVREENARRKIKLKCEHLMRKISRRIEQLEAKTRRMKK